MKPTQSGGILLISLDQRSHRRQGRVHLLSLGSNHETSEPPQEKGPRTKGNWRTHHPTLVDAPGLEKIQSKSHNHPSGGNPQRPRALSRRSTYLPSKSVSMFNSSPVLRFLRLVTFRVWGITQTRKLCSRTSATVKLMPSSATDPRSPEEASSPAVVRPPGASPRPVPPSVGSSPRRPHARRQNDHPSPTGRPVDAPD